MEKFVKRILLWYYEKKHKRKVMEMSGMYTEENNSKAVYLPIEKVRPNPYQPRKEMDKSSLEELCQSIREYGLMQPIVVRQINECDYELIAGERRLRACRMAGMPQIPAVVVRAGGTDSAVMALIENIQRESLDYMEEAEAFCSLISEHGLTQEELAMRIGKNQSTIANKIRILKLSPEIRRLLVENALSERHARALLRLSDEKSRLRAINLIVSRGLNVAKSEELIEQMLGGFSEKEPEKGVDSIRVFKDVRIFSNTIKQAVDLMNKSGIEAKSTKVENDEFIEYTIKIPKNLKNAV